MKKEIKWNCTKEEDEIIGKIVDRVIQSPLEIERIDLVMDITAVHCNYCKLDLEKLLNADDFNFYHDIYGIMRHIDRTTGKLQNCFLPRCSIL